MAAGQAEYDGQMENALIALQLNTSGTFEALYSGGLRTKPLGGVQVSPTERLVFAIGNEPDPSKVVKAYAMSFGGGDISATGAQANRSRSSSSSELLRPARPLSLWSLSRVPMPARSAPWLG